HKGETLQNQAGGTAGTSPAATTMPFEQGKKGKVQRFATEAGASAAPETSPVAESFEHGNGKHKGQKFENEPAVSGGPGSSTADYEQGNGKKKGHERGEQTPGYGSAMTPQNSNQPGSQNASGGPGGYSGGGRHRDQQTQSQGQPQGGQSN